MIFLHQQKQKFLTLFLGWMLLLLFLALLPNSVCRRMVPCEACFTAAHYVSYFVVAYLLCLYLRFRRTMFSIRMCNLSLVWMVFVLMFACSAATEGIQVFADGRTVCWSDFFCNLEGGALGIVFSLAAKKLKERFVLKKTVAEEPKYCPVPR